MTECVPGPLPPLFATTVVPAMEQTFGRLLDEWEMPARRPLLSLIHGRLYLTGSWGMNLFQIARTIRVQMRWFRDVERRWREEWLPELQAAVSVWQRHPADMSEGELLQGIDALAAAGADYWRAAYVARWSGLPEFRFTVYYNWFVKRRDDPHVSAFLRGLGTRSPREATYTAAHLDFVHPTMGEDPRTLRLLRLQPPLDEERLRAEAEEAAGAVMARLDPLRRALFRRLWREARRWAALREEANFYFGLPWPTLRAFVLELERRHGLPRGSAFFLTRVELASPPADAAARSSARRQRWEARWLEEAPLMYPAPFRLFGLRFDKLLPGGRTLPGGRGLIGCGVSGGRVTAKACVIRSPAEFERMQPGAILVAPMTSPPWTPLFAMAAGLVTDVGGPLSHGSIVAREYGIPAVVATGNATRLIETGQRITLDGDRGRVEL